MKNLFLGIIFTIAIVSATFAFSVSRDPFMPLVKSQKTYSSLPNTPATITPEFTLKMVMWGSLKGALLQDANGMVYVVKQGTKIGQIQVIKILPNKVILKTPNGIKELSLKNPNNIILQPNNQNKSVQDISNKTLSNEVKP
ncbi:hypothetical protein [Desulfurella sp.]|uniref:hypothetical protein n=1 Tax=Desulfurella sp. TaxID=1962857 RepID=UPI0025C373E7|nr:hypothetical protein [Desulfurella sp.]